MRAYFIFILTLIIANCCKEYGAKKRPMLAKFFLEKSGHKESEMLLNMLGVDEFLKLVNKMSSSKSTEFTSVKIAVFVLRAYTRKLIASDGKNGEGTLAKKCFFSPSNILGLAVLNPKFERALTKYTEDNRDVQNYFNAYFKYVRDGNHNEIVPFQNEFFENPLEILQQVKNYEKEHEKDISFALELVMLMSCLSVLESNFPSAGVTLMSDPSNGFLMFYQGLVMAVIGGDIAAWSTVYFIVTMSKAYGFHSSLLSLFQALQFGVVMYLTEGTRLYSFISKMKNHPIGKFRLKSSAISILSKAAVAISSIGLISLFLAKIDQFHMNDPKGEYMRETARNLSKAYCLIPFINIAKTCGFTLWGIIGMGAFYPFVHYFFGYFSPFGRHSTVLTWFVSILSTAVQELDFLMFFRETSWLFWLTPFFITKFLIQTLRPNSTVYKVLGYFFEAIWGILSKPVTRTVQFSGKFWPFI